MSVNRLDETYSNKWSIEISWYVVGNWWLLIYDATSAFVQLLLECCDWESVCIVTEYFMANILWHLLCYICKYDNFPLTDSDNHWLNQQILHKKKIIFSEEKWHEWIYPISYVLVIKYFFSLHFYQDELQTFDFCKLQRHQLPTEIFEKCNCKPSTAGREEEDAFRCLNNSEKGDVSPRFQGMLSSKRSNSCTCTGRFVNVPQHNKWIHWKKKKVLAGTD